MLGPILSMLLIAAPAPSVVGTFPENEADVVRFPDGTLKIFYNERGKHVGSMTSTDDGRSWSEPREEFAVTGETAHAIQVLLDRRGELHVFYLGIVRNGRKLGVDYFLDLWVCSSTANRTRWQPPRRAYHGAVGALRGIVQTKSGRIVVPFSTAHPDRKSGPPTGNFYTTAIYSDDDGATWQSSPAQLTAPCHADYNGGNYGAVEPTIVELRDGRLWMLIRTQTGRMYESFSTDGRAWSPAAPSRFYGSNSPAMLRRLNDDRLLLIWNNCAVQPKPPEGGVYSGRDAIHAAASDDDGKTWRGFREIYRDPTRHASSDLRNDRGTAYPDAVEAQDGSLIVVTGQGAGRRAILRIDPAWLTATQAEDDFLHGLDAWHVMQEYGPAERFWRARKPGAELIEARDGRSSARALSVGRKADDPPAGAVWNFPAARQGRLTLKLRTGEAFGGADVALTDRLYAPCDDNAVREARYRLHLPAGNERLGGEWHTLVLAWDDARRECQVTLDGTALESLQVNEDTDSFGPSYLCVRSTAQHRDEHGLQLAEVKVEVER